jgi:hypothetical protein
MLQGCVTPAPATTKPPPGHTTLAPLDVQAHGMPSSTAGSAARGPSDQPTPTGRPDNGTSPGSPHVRRPFTCPPSSNSMYVTRYMVIGSLVGASQQDPLRQRTDHRELQDLADHAYRLPATTRNVHHDDRGRRRSTLLSHRVNNAHCVPAPRLCRSAPVGLRVAATMDRQALHDCAATSTARGRPTPAARSTPLRSSP